MYNKDTANLTKHIDTLGVTYIEGKVIILAIIILTKGTTGNVAKLYNSNVVLGENSQLFLGSLDTVNNSGSQKMGFPVSNGFLVKTIGGASADLLVVYREY